MKDTHLHLAKNNESREDTIVWDAKLVRTILFAVVGCLVVAQIMELSITSGERVISYNRKLAAYNESAWFLPCYTQNCLTVPQVLSARYYVNSSSSTDFHDLVIKVHFDTKTMGRFLTSLATQEPLLPLSSSDREYVLNLVKVRTQLDIDFIIAKHGKLLSSACWQPKTGAGNHVAPTQVQEVLRQRLKDAHLEMVGLTCQVGL